MEGGPPIFGQDFTCPALLEDPCAPLPVPGCHRLWRAVPGASGSCTKATGLVRVRSPLLAESLLLSFPPATEMVQFAGFASCGYRFTARSRLKRGVAPFGHPRITGRSPLPSAFRSVPRPSSPLGTKASTRCPFRAAPAPSPQHARSEVRSQRTDVPADLLAPSGDRAHTAAPPMLAHRHHHAYPCSRSNLTPAGDGRTCFTVTTRFTMSTDQMSEDSSDGSRPGTGRHRDILSRHPS